MPGGLVVKNGWKLMLQILEQRVHVAGDEGHRVVDLVRHARGHHAQAGELLLLEGALVQHPQSALGLRQLLALLDDVLQRLLQQVHGEGDIPIGARRFSGRHLYAGGRPALAGGGTAPHGRAWAGVP
jgi:hypothetical protein